MIRRGKKAALRRRFSSTVTRQSSGGGEGNLSVTKLDKSQENCKNIQNVNLKMFRQWVFVDIFLADIFAFFSVRIVLAQITFIPRAFQKETILPSLRTCNSENS